MSAGPAPGGADLVLLGADVRALDDRGSRASAVAIADGRIVAVGTDADVRSLAGPAAELADLGGRTVLPGINDSHAHVGWWALATAPGSLDLRAGRAPSPGAVQAAVAEAAARMPPGEWILGYGWDHNRWEGRRLPARGELDAVAPHHPVALTHFSGRARWVNGEALRRAGIDGATAVPPGSVVVRDERSGTPTGVLIEPGATALVARLIPAPPVASLADVLEDAIAALHRRGITSFTEPALSPGDPDRAFTFAFADAYAHLARAGRLRARVSVLEYFHTGGVTSAADVREGLASGPRLSGVDPRRLRVGGAKIFSDGVFSGRTSWVREPYAGGGHGSLVVAGDDDDARVAELRAAIAAVHDAGRQVQVHATGDAAIEATVDAMAAAIERLGPGEPGHVLIHGVLAGRAVLARMAEHGITLNAQPTIARIVGGNLFRLLGAERARDQSPLRWALDAGVDVALSTDIPIAPSPDWRATVADAVTRVTDAGQVIEGQRLTLDEALRGVTIAGARQDGCASWKGSVEPGKVADLCVLDGRLDDGDVDALRTMDVAATLFEGELVHGSLAG
jgi:predicted amidohydrolase YtcJ